MKREVRLTNAPVEVRNVEGEVKRSGGYAALYNSRTELWPGVYEELAPGFFDDVLGDDVRALFNHDANLVLGRTGSGTLRLSLDDKGLRYEYDTPDTTAGKDLQVLIERGDVTQSSFGFWPDMSKAERSTLEDGSILIRQTRAKKLYDVSPVTYPAYEDTSVEARSAGNVIKEWLKEENQEEPNTNPQKLALARAQLRYSSAQINS